MLGLFGMKMFDDLRRALAEIEEGIEEDGHSTFFHVLRRHKGFRERAEVTPDELAAYDENIMRHMTRINTHRDVPIRLKYYQWLAALFTEAYLDRYFRGPGKLAAAMETALEAYITENHPGFDTYDLCAKFAPDMTDLRKCAYWMATGSGKTFLIHLAYFQFKHYNRGPHHLDIDRVLLITPNADLTAQHLREMKKSGIPASEFDTTGLDGYFQTQPGEIVSVIEITRLTEDKKDGGMRRVDIESFEKKNLIFVDEAHKGSGGERWKYFRRELAREGFTFEYSATFGQAAAPGAGGDADNLTAFAKTILFDYSYPHFYNDGYGKEYRILNVNEKKHETNRVLLANLLTYYEQKLAFAHNREVAASYNIADPLWIFVGSKVNVSGTKSDVLKVVSFLNTFLTDRDWAIRTTEEFLRGNSGLIHESTNHDLFDPAFPEQRLRYLRQQGMDAATIYNDILLRVFRCHEANGLTLVHIKNSDGEIGLKCGDNDFFGDIYVGDASTFLNIVEKHEPTIPITKIDHVSLFRTIDDPDSTVNLLIGAKKFIEGWDCYRVSCMGLINIGKSEGTEIIQLFGRGVRLRGKNYSLKRSTNAAGDQPPDLPLLETLNIFGVDAKYVGHLRNFLTIEGVNATNTVDKSIEIKIQDDYLTEGLLIPRWDKAGFARKERFVLTKTDIVPATVDLLVRAESEDSAHFRGIEADTCPEPVSIDPAYLDYIDWERVYFTLLDFKAAKKDWHNMIFTRNLLREIITDPACYTLYCADHMVKPAEFKEMQYLENVIVLILQKSLQVSYGRKKNIWIRENSHLNELTKDNNNFTFKAYTVKIKENEQEIIAAVDHIGKHLNDFIEGQKNKFITNVYFGTHLFQPLLTKTLKYSEKLTLSPEGLNEGEEQFVRDLWAFVEDENHAEFFENHKLFLLRNLPKKGVGFYKTAWYYPDFILWMKNTTTQAQRVIFVDPKGLVELKKGFDEEKIQLCHDIKDLQNELIHKTGRKDLTLDSYIISVTPRSDIHPIFKPTSPDAYDTHHILFQNERGYVEKMLLL